MNYLSINAFELARLISVFNHALYAQESSFKASSSSTTSYQETLILRVSCTLVQRIGRLICCPATSTKEETEQACSLH